jgi:hypothetical protein
VCVCVCVCLYSHDVLNSFVPNILKFGYLKTVLSAAGQNGKHKCRFLGC